MFINVWLAITDTAEDVILTRLRWDEQVQGEYSGPITERQHRLFRLMADQEVVRKLFKTTTAQGKTWKLWSISFNEDNNALLKIKFELDNLVVLYPGELNIVGAWHRDGRQVGTDWTDETQTATIGTPTYPIPASLIDFMPDIDEAGTRPTSLSDINLVMGQSARIF